MHGQDPGPRADLEQYREYLTLIARLQIQAKYRGKVDSSGIVNKTLHEAGMQVAVGRGPAQNEQTAWLRTILAHNIKDEVRRYTAKRRDAGKEVSLEACLDESLRRLQLVAEQTSPSGKACRAERMLLLADALAKLPENQRKAIECVWLQRMTQDQAAEELETTRPAIAGLVRRGMERLHELLSGIEGLDD